MADITISDLELAPALADDMVLAVENTTDTYAATLAMLRRLINKTFVEVENADFNALTDDGFYQCTGTPTNSPVAGAINWTLQVSAENGVVVQRAFSLDDSFANLYIRRWNGVTWTGWLEVGAGALDNKANISLSNLDATGQAILNGKADINASNFTATGKSILSGLGMPSNKTVDLTVGASGARYTAPGNGYFSAYNANGTNGAVRFVNITKGLGINSPATAGLSEGVAFVPAETGDVIDMFYTGTFNATGNGWFRFVYAKGEANV